jgi:hypothetical protein
VLKPSDSSIGTHAAARGERKEGLEKANVAMRQPAVVVLQSCALALALLGWAGQQVRGGGPLLNAPQTLTSEAHNISISLKNALTTRRLTYLASTSSRNLAQWICSTNPQPVLPPPSLNVPAIQFEHCPLYNRLGGFRRAEPHASTVSPALCRNTCSPASRRRSPPRKANCTS